MTNLLVVLKVPIICWGPPWLYGSWIYNYLCNQCLSHWCCEFKSRSGRGVQHYVIW